MIEIKDLLSKFNKILSSSEVRKQVIGEVLLEVVGLEINSKKIKIKNNIVYLDIKPIYKNEIFLKKEKIFNLLKEKLGENKTYLDAALTGENIELAFNYKYFLDCFQSINSDSLSIKFNQSSKPIVVSGVSDNSFIYLIMPMNR